MRYRYDGELTYDPILGKLTPGMEGEGPDDVVALKIQAGLLRAVEEESARVEGLAPPVAWGPARRRRAGAESVEES